MSCLTYIFQNVPTSMKFSYLGSTWKSLWIKKLKYDKKTVLWKDSVYKIPIFGCPICYESLSDRLVSESLNCLWPKSCDKKNYSNIMLWFVEHTAQSTHLGILLRQTDLKGLTDIDEDELTQMSQVKSNWHRGLEGRCQD